MYKPRPAPGRERVVFDFALRSRLSELAASGGAVLFICDSRATSDSLDVFQRDYPSLKMVAMITNPPRWEGETPDTPARLDWDTPEGWQRYQVTDRWTRILVALDAARRMDSSGYLVMPAHDAVWGNGLLKRLAQVSQQHAKNGLPAAVSPYTPYQHSTVPGVEIPDDVIRLMNTAFERDPLLWWKIRRQELQAFWGKMGMIPFGMCGAIRDLVDTFVWEDDLEIDRVIRDLGYMARCVWVNDAALYRQALPVFDREGARQVIARILHYSLNIPNQSVGASSLNFPLGRLGKLRRLVDPTFARYNAEAEALIRDCTAEIRARLEGLGASWVDWGNYRHVMRVGDAVVEVWKRENDLV